MKRLSVKIISDTIFSAIIGFLISFVLFYYLVKYTYAIAFATCISLLFGVSTYYFSSRKKLKSLSKTDNKNMQTVFNRLKFMPATKIVDLFGKALKKQGVNFTRKNNVLYDAQKKEKIFFCFGFDAITKSDIVKIYNQLDGENKAIIYSENFPDEIVKFVNLFDNKFNLVFQEDVYKLLKKTDCLPQSDFYPTEQKKSPIKFLAKKRAKSYFAFGFTFLLSSFFVFYKIYYIVFGCIMLIMAVLCKLFGKD